MSYRRGDLALVPFPFTDLSSAKRRPVLLLADPDGCGDCFAVAATSRPHHSNSNARVRRQSLCADAL
jgi:mRNA interferase MazF